MNAYLVHFDLAQLSQRLSEWFSCRLSVADVRELLQAAGFVESTYGWLTSDLRPLMLVSVPPGRALF